MPGLVTVTGSARSRAFSVTPHEVHCWRVGLDVHPNTSARLYATLSVDERSRVARYRFQRDRQRFIVAHGALREILGRYLQTAPGHIRYVHNAFGKPDLGPGFGGQLKFNLSHSADMALVAITAGSEVGVDLERVRAGPDYAEIARRFFSTAEMKELHSLPEHLHAEAFLRFWTMKEAYLKARGGGLVMPLNASAAPGRADSSPGSAAIGVASGDVARTARWSVHTLQPCLGYVGALALDGDVRRLEYNEYSAVCIRTKRRGR